MDLFLLAVVNDLDDAPVIVLELDFVEIVGGFLDLFLYLSCSWRLRCNSSSSSVVSFLKLVQRCSLLVSQHLYL